MALAGVRADWDRLFQAGLVQPRLALNWMPLKDNRGKFSIGWGMYNIPLNLSVIGQAYDQQEVDTLYNAPGKVPIQGPATSAFVLPTNGLQSLQQPYFDIASAGWEQEVGENTLVSVELLARDQHHGLAWETLSPGQIGSEFLLQSSRRDKYRGATVTARHTFKNTAVLFGSYTRSKASSDQVLDPALGALYFAPQQAGPLVGCAEPNIDVGALHADLGNFVFVFVRLPYGFSLQRNQPATVSVWGGKFVPVSGLREFDDRTGEEIHVQETGVCGAGFGNQHFEPAESGRGGEQRGRAGFWDVHRRAGESRDGAIEICGKK